jgi:hypothetical protein
MNFIVSSNDLSLSMKSSLIFPRCDSHCDGLNRDPREPGVCVFSNVGPWLERSSGDGGGRQFTVIGLRGFLFELADGGRVLATGACIPLWRGELPLPIDRVCDRRMERKSGATLPGLFSSKLGSAEARRNCRY